MKTPARALSRRVLAGIRNLDKCGQRRGAVINCLGDIKVSTPESPRVYCRLPMQAVFQGKTTGYCPSPDAARYEEAIELGYVMLPSGYWCTQATMCLLANDIIAPYFDATKAELGLPQSQFSIWLIDLWTVHKSNEFREWMKENHPTIIVLYVPGGCTDVWQPLDVGIQRLMKLSIKSAAHRDIVEEALRQIKAGKPGHEIKLDTTIGTLRDRSVGWTVQAIHDISDPATIAPAFEMCRVGNWNLSHTSLTSPETLAGLRDLRTTDPTLLRRVDHQWHRMFSRRGRCLQACVIYLQQKNGLLDGKRQCKHLVMTAVASEAHQRLLDNLKSRHPWPILALRWRSRTRTERDIENHGKKLRDAAEIIDMFLIPSFHYFGLG